MSEITTCSACAFYVSRGEQEGVCRRYPPSSGNTGFQPPVRPTGGCGEGELKAELRCQKCGKPLPSVGAPCEICGKPVAEINALRAQIAQMSEERADLLRRFDAARHAHNMVAEKNQEICKFQDLIEELNKTICQVQDQNAGQCQEIVQGLREREALQLRLDRREQEYQDLARTHRADCDKWAKEHPLFGKLRETAP